MDIFAWHLHLTTTKCCRHAPTALTSAACLQFRNFVSLVHPLTQNFDTLLIRIYWVIHKFASLLADLCIYPPHLDTYVWHISGGVFNYCAVRYLHGDILSDGSGDAFWMLSRWVIVLAWVWWLSALAPYWCSCLRFCASIALAFVVATVGQRAVYWQTAQARRQLNGFYKMSMAKQKWWTTSLAYSLVALDQ